MKDEILEELWRVKDQIVAETKGNTQVLFDHMRKVNLTPSQHIVNRIRHTSRSTPKPRTAEQARWRLSQFRCAPLGSLIRTLSAMSRVDFLDKNRCCTINALIRAAGHTLACHFFADAGGSVLSPIGWPAIYLPSLATVGTGSSMDWRSRGARGKWSEVQRRRTRLASGPGRKCTKGQTRFAVGWMVKNEEKSASLFVGVAGGKRI